MEADAPLLCRLKAVSRSWRVRSRNELCRRVSCRGAGQPGAEHGSRISHPRECSCRAACRGMRRRLPSGVRRANSQSRFAFGLRRWLVELKEFKPSLASRSASAR